jgi:predicted Zn-ribbon and HTH transcriptional regulator
MKIKIKSVECKKCGHDWKPRNSEIRQCPKCKSAWWDVTLDKSVKSVKFGVSYTKEGK